MTTKKSYEVIFKKSALKELQALPDRVKQKIMDAVQLLALNPYTELLQIKKLKGADSLFRIRIQDYRVLYSVENEVLKVMVVRVAHRREVYE